MEPIICTMQSQPLKRALQACMLATNPQSKWHPYDCLKITYYSDGSLEIVGTDRYRAARARIHGKHEQPREIVKSVIVTSYEMAKFLSLVKPPNKHRPDTSITLEFTDGLVISWDAWSYNLHVIETEFPDVNKIMDQTDRNFAIVGLIQFNPAYLGDAAAACKLMSQGHYGVKMTFSGVDKPALMRPSHVVEFSDFAYLLMPILEA